MISPRLFSRAGRLRSSMLVALLMIGAVWGAAASFTGSRIPPTPRPPESGPDVRGPFTHANLAIYLVHGQTTDTREYITLDEGLTTRTVTVREKGSGAGGDAAEVNTLEIENRSDQWLFLQAGDIVKGGKQDRTIMTDLTLAPHSGPQPLEAFCVEHGRWTPSRDGLAFASSPEIVAGASLKRAIQGGRPDAQTKVWDEVANTEARAAAKIRTAGGAGGLAIDGRLSNTGTYNAIADNETLGADREAYVAALLPLVQKDKTAVGLAVAINGVVTSADVYASPALFQRLSSKLVRSYALEAVLALDGAPQGCAVSTIDEVKAFLSKPAPAKASIETVGHAMRRATRDVEDAVMYEYSRAAEPSKADGKVVVLHKNYVKK